MDRLEIKEAIVVEGRDDTAALRKVTDALIIETHGFGIKRETWELLEKAYGRLKTPVDRILYVKGTAQIEHPIASGIRALARQSMIGVNDQDGAIAISKKEAAKIPAEDICTKQYFEDFGGAVIEVWSYDPIILERDGCVDDISLLLSMDNDPNERVQTCLDEIRQKHGLPIKEEE